MTTTPPTTLPGRNEPCWCGSGRKYKRCHAEGDRAGRRDSRTASRSAQAERVADRVRPGRLSPTREVPASIDRPPYVDDPDAPEGEGPAEPRTEDEIARMRRTGRLAAEVLDALGPHIRAGVTTDELDARVHAHALAVGAYPSPLHYRGFPKSVCTSVNEVICHGIPDDRALRDGDILNVDVTLYAEGVHGDMSRMFLVGEVDDERRRLVEVTEQAMHAGIAAGVAGAQVRDIGRAIERVADAAGLGVVRAFVGHGVGPEFHSAPTVYHYDDPTAVTEIVPGMTFTIEPMLTLGDWRHTMWRDGWTAVTADLSASAQWEHTVLVREDGVELLTVPEGAAQPHLP